MPTPADAAAVVTAVSTLRAVRHRTAGTRFVGIDGFGAAGKSTLAARVQAEVPGVDVVHVDDFAGPRVAEWDWERFRVQLLEPLLADGDARYQIWDWNSDSGGPWVDVEPGRILVVEGVSATRDEAGVPWSLRVWVDAPADIRRDRALERDGPAMWPVWADRWIPAEQAYAAAQRPRDRADLTVAGTAG